MKSKNLTTLLTVTIVTTLLLAGCQPLKPAAISNDQVVQVVENTLSAIDAGDYETFTQDFSDEMKKAFSEEQFTSLAGMLKNASGNYVSCADSEPVLSNNQGYAVYRLLSKWMATKSKGCSSTRPTFAKSANKSTTIFMFHVEHYRPCEGQNSCKAGG
jgi:hypothetical protein